MIDICAVVPHRRMDRDDKTLVVVVVVVETKQSRRIDCFT